MNGHACAPQIAGPARQNLERRVPRAEEAQTVTKRTFSLSLFCERKESRVDRYDYRACRHKHRTCSWRQYDAKWIEDARRERYGKGVVASCPPKVLHHLSIRAAR